MEDNVLSSSLNVSTMTDSFLEWNLKYWYHAMERAKSDLKEADERCQEINTELARRKLDAFWQANPGLRLEVGDALLMTKEYERWYREQYRTNSFLASFDRPYVINGLDIYKDGKLMIDCEGLRLGYIPLDIARRMRLAYLQAHGEAQP